MHCMVVNDQPYIAVSTDSDIVYNHYRTFLGMGLTGMDHFQHYLRIQLTAQLSILMNRHT